MTITIELDEARTRNAARLARDAGFERIDLYIREMIDCHALQMYSERSMLSPREAAEALGRFGRGRKLGPDLSTQDLINEGRR